MKGFLIGLSKLILGMAIALSLLSMAGVATARYFMARLAVLPAKPLYGDEIPAPPPPDPVAMAPADSPAEIAPGTNPVASPAVEPAAEAPIAAEPAAEELPPDSYRAIVSQPIGLVLRSGPGTEHGQVSGIAYNAEVIVLEEPAGQGWIKVQVASTGAEGWVRAGNTRRQD